MRSALPLTGEFPAPSRSAELSPTNAPRDPLHLGPTIERAGAEVYVVAEGERTVGFIDVVGAVFVALRGRYYDRAVEVAQTRELDRAAALIVAHHRVHGSSGRAM